MITNPHTGTNVHEIAAGIYRINTPIDLPDGQAFSFNQYLLVDDEPLLFHTGPRALFPVVSEAMACVMPVERLRYVGLSHMEADECGSLNHWGSASRWTTSYAPQTAATLARLAQQKPRTLACMHGSAWRGDGGTLLRHLAEALSAPR